MTAIAALLMGMAGLSAVDDRTITVFAAASLREAFTDIAHRYEATHEGTHVRLSFAGSQQLAAQIKAGAEVDVFATAGPAQLRAAGEFASPIRTFAHNALTVVVPVEEKRVGGLADIAKVDRLVVADAAVPAGAYTLEVFSRARQRFGAPWRALVDRRIVSREADVRAVLAKVMLGEADAGVVYVSDAHSAGDKVRAIPIPRDLNIVATYPVAVPATSKQVAPAKDFIQFLFTPESQKALEANGFTSPLRPIKELRIVGGLTTKAVMTDHLEATKGIALKAKNTSGTTQTFKGASLVDLLSGFSGTVARFEGADGIAAEISLASIRRNGGVLIGMGDGNVQVVLPGQSPSKWVRWLRRIVVR